MSEPRPRPGRFRRWVLRPLAWSLAALCVLVFVGEQLLDAPWVADRVRELVRTRLVEVLGRPVELGGIEFSLLPLEVEIRELVIADPDPEHDALLVVPWAAIQADLSTLGRRHLHLREVRIERPVLSLRFLEDGSNLPVLAGDRTGGEGVELFIDHVEIDEAEVVLDHRPASFSVRARHVRSRLQGTGEARLAGRLLAEAVRLRLPETDAPLDVAAAGRFEVGRDGVDVSGLRISHPRLDVRIDGRCEWAGAEPRCALEHRTRTEGALASELGWFDDLDGTIDARGNLEWRPSTFGFRARVESPRLALLETAVDDVRGQLVLDRFGVRLQLEEASWSSGTLAGTAEVDLQDPRRPIDLELLLEDVGLDRVLADRGVPLDGAASRLDGRVRYLFPLAEPLEGDGSVDVGIRADPALAGLPLEGDVGLRIRDGVLSTQAATFRARNQSILARGRYDLARRSGRFEWEGRSLDVGELVGLLPGGLSEEPWMPTDGTGTFDGTLAIRDGAVTADIRLELDGVETPRLDLDHAVGGFRIDREGIRQLRLELQRPDEAILVSGQIPFETRPGGRAIELAVDVVDATIATIRPWVPVESLPLEGRVTGRVELTVAGEETSGRLTAVMEPATVAGIPVRSLATRLGWSPETLRIEDLTALTEAGVVEGSGSLGFGPDDPVDLRARGEALRLDREPVAGRLPLDGLDGRLDLRARMTGTFASPRVEVEAEVREVVAAGGVPGSGQGRLAAEWADDRIVVGGQLFDLLTIAGGGTLARPGGAADGALAEPTRLELDLSAADLAGLRPLFPEDAPQVGGSLAGLLVVETGADPAWSGRLELDRLELVLAGRRLENLEPVSAVLDPTGLRIESLWIANPQGTTEIFVGGTATGLGSDAALDLRLQGSVAGAWIESFVPDVSVAGTFEVLGRIQGTFASPTLDGQGGIRRASLALPGDFPHAFSEVDGLVLFYPDSVVLDHLRSRFAGGTTSIEGSVDPGTLDFRFRAAGRDLELRVLDGWLLDGDVDLAIRRLDAAAGIQVSGTARLDRLEYAEDVPVSLSQLLTTFLRRQRIEAGLAETPLADVHVNIAIDAANAVAVHNNVADLEGSAELVLRGTLAQPILFGRVDLAEGGKIVYNDTEYEVERGRLTFANPRRIDPEVDLVATTEIREFDVTLILSGTTERLDADFTSDPPLPDLEVFRLLTTGDVEDRVGATQSVSAASFLYGQAASLIGKRVGSLFGFDQFRIDPLTGSGDNISNARITVGKRISRDLYVTFSADPASTEEQQLRLEWQVSESVVVVLTQNGDGTYEADVRWENRF